MRLVLIYSIVNPGHEFAEGEVPEYLLHKLSIGAHHVSDARVVQPMVGAFVDRLDEATHLVGGRARSKKQDRKVIEELMSSRWALHDRLYRIEAHVGLAPPVTEGEVPVP